MSYLRVQKFVRKSEAEGFWKMLQDLFWYKQKESCWKAKLLWLGE